MFLMATGLVGSGKTTYFTELAKRIPESVYLDKDTIARPMLGKEAYFSEYYFASVHVQSHLVLLNLAFSNLKLGKLALADGYFGNKLNEPWFLSFVAEQGLTPLIVYFHCSGEKELERINLRNDPRDSDKVGDKFPLFRLNHIKGHLRDLATVSHALIIDTENDDSLEANIALIQEGAKTGRVPVSPFYGKVLPDEFSVDQAMLSLEDLLKLYAEEAVPTAEMGAGLYSGVSVWRGPVGAGSDSALKAEL